MADIGEEVANTSEYFDLELAITDSEKDEILKKEAKSVLEQYSDSELDELDNILDNLSDELVNILDTIDEKMDKNSQNRALLEDQIEEDDVFELTSDLNNLLTYKKIEDDDELINFTNDSTQELLRARTKIVELNYRLQQIDFIQIDLSKRKVKIESLRNFITDLKIMIEDIKNERA